ncbi:hypothetical protein TRIATDRAFT_30031 [Trichoderma atroviride IMI 206040]|uniref:Peptidase M3A/M3B catalytic domain-containing protein n=1 Tax=Hypocrea atroviridis (strain ATCC 20476 / IMI 206040) TaxID=452589 RepID=G9P6C6_HYPAI|nr:uncharacterized protein TRIATDRAFT_30031 [Trichoderma atroviride IMI 206040]EHK42241.1 hypothetical protein TRIATDRAFT_30031 [Trichoderma atroviride IMI 206040]
MIQPSLSFSATPASITADAERLVRQSRHQRDELVRNIAPEQATFAKVMLPLAQMQNDFAIEANVLCFYRHVSANADIRTASAKAQTLFDRFHTECWMREDIFKLVDAIYHNHNTEEITKESSLFLETVYDKFAQSGLGIRDTVSREQFKEIKGRLSQIHAEFRENLGCQTDEVFFTLAELDGVPESIVKQLEINSSNKLRIDLSNPVHRGILSSAEKGETRKKLYFAIQNRCKGNAPLVQEAVRLRYEMAKMLGFANYAAFQLQSRMAKTPDRVNEFLADLRSKLTPYGVASLRILQDFKKSDVKNDGNGEFFLWDDDFYRNRMLKSRISIDRTRIKEYFPLQTTTTALLNLLAQLFGLLFDEIKATDSMVWHTDVQMFAVHDDETHGGGFLGYLYLDLFRRDGKYPGASCFNLQPGFIRIDGKRHYPSTALLCAFSKPTPSKPTLLSHFQVVTMLHELGHGIHDLVSKTQHSHFHGPEGVPVDFGEMPSQMLEYWCWTPSQIKSLSSHYSYINPEMLALWKQQNKGKIQPELQMPDELIEALIKASRVSFGPLSQLDQLHRAYFDMTIHQLCSDEEVESVDLTMLWNKSRKEIGLIDGQEVFDGHYAQGHDYTTFPHLMINDYTAGYYAYLYSKVYAADLFYSEFQNHTLDTERVQRYRKCVLESGGSRDGFQNLVDFLGREPSADAFYNSLLD